MARSIGTHHDLEADFQDNAKKSKNLYIGKRIEKLHDVTLNGKTIDWVDEWTYLGVTLKSNKAFDCSTAERVKKFSRKTTKTAKRSKYDRIRLLI